MEHPSWGSPDFAPNGVPPLDCGRDECVLAHRRPTSPEPLQPALLLEGQTEHLPPHPNAGADVPSLRRRGEGLRGSSRSVESKRYHTKRRVDRHPASSPLEVQIKEPQGECSLNEA